MMEQQANYKALFERLEETLEEITDLILFARADCQEVLENADERKPVLSPAAEQHLDVLVRSLRLSSELEDDVNYKKMYLTLFNAVTGAIQHLEWHSYGRAKEMRIQAQRDAEEIYINEEA